jgi:hypothetical protein
MDKRYIDRVECSGCGQLWHEMDCGGCGSEIEVRYVPAAEIERLREAIRWYVAEREKYLRREPTAGLDHAWENLRMNAR